MIDDMILHGLKPKTIRAYVACVARFARHFGKSPTVLGTPEIRQKGQALPSAFSQVGTAHNQKGPTRLDALCAIMYTTRFTQEIRPWPSLACVKLMLPWRAGTTVCRAVSAERFCWKGATDRKAWIENRIEELAQISAVAVGGFAVMTNHLHLDSSREGMLAGFSLGSYLLLVDYTGRQFRAGKSALSAELAGIFDRLGTTGESWRIRLEKLSKGRLFGRFFASNRDTLKKVAGRLGMRSVWNLGGCAVR